MKAANDIPWLKAAYGYVGVHEGTDLKANPLVLKFFKEAGHGEIKNDHKTPWCAAFVGAVLAECGLRNTGSLWALDYAKYGQKLYTPIVGAIATKKRNGGGHVFFVAGFDANYVYALGGNQDDQVCISRIARRAVHSYCWPPGVPVPVKSSAGTTKAAATNATEA